MLLQQYVDETYADHLHLKMLLQYYPKNISSNSVLGIWRMYTGVRAHVQYDLRVRIKYL